MSETYFRKGFRLGKTVAPVLQQSYASTIVGRIKELGYRARAGDVTLHLAREFGFCYGVDRAVQYAYEAREQFPDRRILLSGEIIHNPDVNRRIEELGIIRIEENPDAARRYAHVTSSDVVLIPAFGVTVAEIELLRGKGCVLVDTTCGSVLNVWKNVRQYARDGYTAVIHGKFFHEETRATASQALTAPGGRYVCVRDRAQASMVCESILGGLAKATFLAAFEQAVSPGFDPEHDLERIGLANQTTMLMSESLAIQEMLRDAMVQRHGETAIGDRFRAFDTICSATQDRQDAVLRLLAEGGLDLMVVIGGYNSSNTQALARLAAQRLPAFHIDGAPCIEETGLRHRDPATGNEIRTPSWLPDGPVHIGLTAGASTPDTVVGTAIERLLALRSLGTDALTSVSTTGAA
jgi:4-hydroxy-3-methylbut-2-enyl diphosphate reductase